MAYTDKTYFLTKIKEGELNLLLKDDAGDVQDDYLTEAVLSADSMIDGYLRDVVTEVPLATPPAIIKQYSYFIALYFLHDRIQYNEIPQRVKDNYDAAINFMKDLAAGRATLEGIEDEEDEDAHIDYDVNENIFTRNTF